ncbi:hypothetical protein HYC85_016741 [Camellia sinensis]|uniref:Ent-kaurenoic acid oxidase n=1 Tax=Camellia sinensis TaxID=4442 RepID=A0A7J7H0I2_CAMSI|nr:hypothetical protein HYC85_016741 [Camellia sinensis]
MEYGLSWVVGVVVFVGICGGGVVVAGLKWLLRSVNWWLYEAKLGEKRYSLPPGDMGWPFIGVMWSFLRAFKSNDPDSFISSFVTRFGRTGLYKAVMFGNPSIIVTTPETCKRVLTDDEYFKPGWPTSTIELVGKKSFIGDITFEEHKRLRKLTAAPVNGHESLSIYMRYIEENVKSNLEGWSGMGQIEFLTKLRKLTFRIITYIFLSAESELVIEDMEREYTAFNYGVRAMAINLPGFAYHKALKARKKLVAILQSVVQKRRQRRKNDPPTSKKDMMDALLDVKDENGKSLDDEEIIDILIMYLNAGHESSGHVTMWATLLLQDHQEMFQRAKAEQEAIVKNMPPTQKWLTLNEYRQMEYLSKVIDETLRVVSFSLMVFREAKAMSIYVVSLYIIVILFPRDGKFWFGLGVCTSTLKSTLTRWDLLPKQELFFLLEQEAGCALEMILRSLKLLFFYTIFFLIMSEFERLNPGCPIMHLPHPRPVDNCLGRIRRVSHL